MDSRRIAEQSTGRSHPEDAAVPHRYHAVLCNILAEQERTADVQIHDLVPGSQRIVLRRGSPGCPGVVDKDIHRSHALDRLMRNSGNVLGGRRIARYPVGGDAAAGECFHCRLQLGGFSGRHADVSACLSQGVRNLEAKPPSATSNERFATLKIEQVTKRPRHRNHPPLARLWADKFQAARKSTMQDDS